MGFMDRLKRETEAQDTPAGRRLELRQIFADSFILLFGCVGLAIWFPPLIYASAIGHILTGFILSRGSLPLMVTFGLVSCVATVAITSALVFVGTYAVQRFYFEVPEAAVMDELISNWMLFVAIGVVMGGIISSLISYPGIVDELVEYKNRSGPHD